MKVTLSRIDDAFNFEAKNEAGKTIIFDGGANIGGKGNGVSPMQSLLMAAGGCSAIDVIMILQKQRQEITHFHIEIEGEREKDKQPALWKEVHVKFLLEGKIDAEKAKRAADLSVTKYCSVLKTLEAAGAAITWEVVLNRDKI